MQTIRTTLFALLAFSWVGLTSHCQIEVLADLGIFCCQTDAHDSGNADPGGSCEDKGCCPLETAQYHPPRHQDFAPLPILLSTDAAALEAAIILDSGSAHAPAGFVPSDPPELAGVWQFRFRTALPPRAPSLTA